jgi:hypothetical protein
MVGTVSSNFHLKLSPKVNFDIKLEIFDDKGKKINDFKVLNEKKYQADLTFIFFSNTQPVGNNNLHEFDFVLTEKQDEDSLHRNIIDAIIDWYFNNYEDRQWSYFCTDESQEAAKGTTFELIRKRNEVRIDLFDADGNKIKVIHESRIKFSEQLVINEKSSFQQLANQRLTFSQSLNRRKNIFTSFFLAVLFIIVALLFLS